jgi:hypothetical protein
MKRILLIGLISATLAYSVIASAQGYNYGYGPSIQQRTNDMLQQQQMQQEMQRQQLQNQLQQQMMQQSIDQMQYQQQYNNAQHNNPHQLLPRLPPGR